MSGLLEPSQVVAAVKGLHWRTSLEIHKLLKDNEDFCISYNDGEEEGAEPVKIDVEKLVGMLPLHLLSVFISTHEEEGKLRYLLSGIRLLNTFCDLTSRHPRLDQVLLDDVVLTTQMLDLVIFTMVALGGNRKESWKSDYDSLIEATMVASTLHLMHGFISPNSQDLVIVLLAHPKVDVFIDAAFGAVHNVVRSLRAKLLYRQADQPKKLGVNSVGAVNAHCQQAEAALQFLHSLCQHKLFRDRVAKNQELCGKGGVLMLAQSILSLYITPEWVGAAVIIASISRINAKALSLLHHLFEAESVSFLDEVERSGSLHLAQTVASKVLELMRLGLSRASKATPPPHEYPMGFVLLNAMRLADVFSDDSHFRRFFTKHFTMVLSAVFCLPHGDFLSMLCSSDLSSREDDATLDYDLFTSSGWVLSAFSSHSELAVPQFKLNFQNNLTMSSYAHQRTSLIVKIMANLHCFVPEVCTEDDRNRFIQTFVSGLRKDPSSILVNLLPSSTYTPEAQRGTSVCKNISSLLHHAEFLIPNALNVEDLMILRVFCQQLEPLIRSEFEESQAEVKDNQGAGGSSSGKQLGKEPLNLNNDEASEDSDVRAEGATTKQGVNNEEMEIAERSKESDNLETSGSETSSNRGGKGLVDQAEDGYLARTFTKRLKVSASSGEAKEDERAEASLLLEKQRTKRKRSIMSDDQMAMMEKALVDEPDMQRNSAWIRTWADKLSLQGPEVTSAQLKNWLNNRKAKLARASKHGPARDNNSSGDLPESPGDENTWQQQQQQKPTTPFADKASASSSEGLKRGQQVMLVDERGVEVGKGTVLKTDGEWYGLSLETRQVCVVDVIELSGLYDYSKMSIPYGSDDVGRTFGEANSRFGVMRVAWDVSKLQ